MESAMKLVQVAQPTAQRPRVARVDGDILALHRIPVGGYLQSGAACGERRRSLSGCGKEGGTGEAVSDYPGGLRRQVGVAIIARV